MFRHLTRLARTVWNVIPDYPPIKMEDELQETMEKTLEQKVHDAAHRLDDVYPQWAGKVSIVTLEMGSFNLYIMAQITGHQVQEGQAFDPILGIASNWVDSPEWAGGDEYWKMEIALRV